MAPSPPSTRTRRLPHRPQPLIPPLRHRRTRHDPLPQNLHLRLANPMPRRWHRPRNLIRKNHHLKKPALLRLPRNNPIPRPDQLRQMPRRINRRHPLQPIVPMTMYTVRLQNLPCCSESHRHLHHPTFRCMPAPNQHHSHPGPPNQIPNQLHRPDSLSCPSAQHDPKTTPAHKQPKCANFDPSDTPTSAHRPNAVRRHTLHYQHDPNKMPAQVNRKLISDSDADHPPNPH